MKPLQDERARIYDPSLFRFSPASFFSSLTLAALVGVAVASVGIVLFALSRSLSVPWHIAAAAGGVGQVVIVSVLVMLVLEQRRKNSLRQAQEFTFLSHHIRNALTQLTLASHISDVEKQQRIRTEALERISGALRRVVCGADLRRLSLNEDLDGKELRQQTEEEEKKDVHDMETPRSGPGPRRLKTPLSFGLEGTTSGEAED